MLMVDEEKQELAFELALGAKGKEVSSFRVKMGEGIAGWVAQTGKPAIVNDTARDPRFAGSSTPRPSSRPARSCARPSSPAGAPSGWWRSSTS